MAVERSVVRKDVLIKMSVGDTSEALLHVRCEDSVLMSPGCGDQQQLWSSRTPCAQYERTLGRSPQRSNIERMDSQ